jgi:protein-disulfide isomerase
MPALPCFTLLSRRAEAFQNIYINASANMLNFFRFEVIYLGDMNSITLSKDTVYGVAIAVLACLLVFSVFTQGFGLVKPAVPQCNVTQPPVNPPLNNTPPVNTTPPANGTNTMQVPPSLDLVPLMGPAGSKISLLEFSDFQCPFCGMAWGKDYAAQYAPIIGTVKKFEAEYVQTGKASFRFIPVAFLGDDSPSDESVNSANAVLCAADQGRFFEMHDAIFNAQDTEENNGKYSVAKLKALGANVSGINATKFNACMDNRTYVDLAATFTDEWGFVSQANTGRAGTPTFYVLVDAAKTTREKVSAAAASAGYDWGMTGDKKLYVIIASPEYAKIKQVVDALA